MRRVYAREVNRAKSAWEKNQQTELKELMKHAPEAMVERTAEAEGGGQVEHKKLCIESEG